eukprot:1370848-Amorphochlora_amoeboformis.AAC.1
MHRGLRSRSRRRWKILSPSYVHAHVRGHMKTQKINAPLDCHPNRCPQVQFPLPDTVTIARYPSCPQPDPANPGISGKKHDPERPWAHCFPDSSAFVRKAGRG